MRFKGVWHFLRDIAKDIELLQIGNRTIDVALPGLRVEGDVVNYRPGNRTYRQCTDRCGRSSVNIVTPTGAVGNAFSDS
jgi:hypothetical protein